MKDNIEKSIKRWLKNKVKVTLGLIVSFLITGNIGYAEVNLTPDENNNIEIKEESTKEIVGLEITKDNNIENINNFEIKVDSAKGEKGLNGEAKGIGVTNAKFTVNAEGKISIVAINNSDENSDKNITNTAYGISMGIENKNSSSEIELKAKENIKIEADSGIATAYAIFANSSGTNPKKIYLESENNDIFLKTNAKNTERDLAAIISADAGSCEIDIDLIAKNGNVTLYGESQTGLIVGVKTSVVTGGDKTSNVSLEGKDIVIETKSKEKTFVLENDSKDSSINLNGENITLKGTSSDETYADYTSTLYNANGVVNIAGGGEVNLESTSNKIGSYGVFAFDARDTNIKGKIVDIISTSNNSSAIGVYADSITKDSFVTVDTVEDLNIKAQGNLYSASLFNSARKKDDETKISLNSSGNLNLSSKDTIASYGIYNNSSGGKATLSLNSKGELVANSLSNNGIAYGVYNYATGGNSKIDINVKENVDINTIGNSNSSIYGVLSFNGSGGSSEVDIKAKNIDIDSKNKTGNDYGLFLRDKAILKADNNIIVNSASENGNTYGIVTGLTNKESVISGSNIEINSKSGFSFETLEKTEGKSSYGMYIEPSSILNLEAREKVNILAQTTGNNAYGLQALEKSDTKIKGDTLNIKSIGKEIDGSNAGDMDTNVTVSKIFNTTQGIRLQDEATLDLTNVNNLNVTSSDIAITANDADFNFNGNSYFEGNSYLVQNYTNDNLLVRPVLQAINDGKIILSGDTTVISRTGEDGSEDETKINNVGIYAQGDINTDILENVTVNGNLTVISGNDVLTEKYNIKTLDELKNLTPGEFKELISNTDIALMATSGGKINIDSNENVFLIGDILSGKANSEVSVKGGNGNPDSMVVIGEVLAANGGKVNLDMSNGGYFVGRADDYFTINEGFKEVGFRNNKFDENIKEGGEVSIKLGNNAIWNTVGQSYVTNLDFTEGGGVVDLTYEGNALRIKNLSGEGTFNLTLDSENKELGNMLYVYNVVDAPQARNMISTFALTADEGVTNEDKVLTQTVNLTDSVLNLQPGEKLRFATLGDQATGKVEFVANEVKERGINNVSYSTENSAYDINDEENVVYNGDGTTTTKPGNSIVNNTAGFNATENWYLTRGKERINDAGTTIIEMSKANYASAVYLDNLNKRLGDMTFAEGKEGFWVRLRNDRVGEDGEYRLHNYMTQLGYDKPYPMEEGKGTEYRGIAFEISKGDMDYKNINGDANVDRQALWLYDTNMYNNGFYSDYVFRAGRMESEFDIYGRETGVKVEGTYKNLFVGASAEYGYRYDLSEKTYLEPQVQLQYTYIDGTDYTTNQETKVELDEIHSVIGRAGARLGHDFYNKEGNKTATLYAKVDINYEFLGDQRVKAKDKTGVIDKKYENDGTWYDIGIGASKDVTPDFNVYMDVERQIGRTRDDQSWQFNLGFRYRFNDVKDLNPVVMLRDFTMKADNYFDFDKSELKPEGKKVVKEISNELTKENATGTLKIEGHTDSIGTNEYNQKLSERRAQSVENEFKQNITTDKIKYETRGYGEERPIADNATKEGRAKNRRVEINFGGTIEN